MEPHEQVMLDNFKAHYNSIVAELASVTQQLERLLDERTAAEEHLASVTQQVDEQLATLEWAREKNYICSEWHLAKKKEIADATERLARDTAAYEARVQREEIARLNSIQSVESKLFHQNSHLDDVVEELDVVSKELVAKTVALADLTENLARLDTVKTECLQTINELLQTKAIEEDKAKKEIEAAHDTLKLVLTQVEAEREKIASPMKLLVSEAARLEKNKRNFEVYRDRLQGYYKQLFPNLSLNFD